MVFTEQQQQQKNSLSLKPQVDKVLFNSENEFSEPLGIGDNPIEHHPQHYLRTKLRAGKHE